MSLLTTVTAANDQQKYFVENIGGAGLTAADAPCIKGTTLGTVRVGNPSAGILIRGDTLSASNENRIAGGQVSGGALKIGNSTTSFQNIVLTDGLTTVNTQLTLAGAGNDLVVADDISLGGNLNLTNGVASGKSISGYFNATIASASYPDGADTAIATPVGLTAGWYIYAVACAPGGQAEEQTSVIVHYNGTLFDIGGAIQSVAGAGSFGFKPSDDRTAMRVHNATGAAQTATVSIAKLLN